MIALSKNVYQGIRVHKIAYCEIPILCLTGLTHFLNSVELV